MKKEERYTAQELEEFKEIIMQKLANTKAELASHKRKIAEISAQVGKLKIQSEEDSTEVSEREHIHYQVRRLETFAKRLNDALHRIERGTYGICVTTGQKIPKERLRLVPHTTHSVIAKETRAESS